MDVIPKIKNTCGEIKLKTVTNNIADILPEVTVYDKIVKLCKKSNITINELAKKSGVNYHTLNSYKNRVYDYRPVTLHKIAAFFGMMYDILYALICQKSVIG
ncbi:MAG: helix-turn-helix transcriptional regulator [Ruminiclostridium sp.]